MNLFEANTQVFILRIWLEPREIEGAVQEWRGMIEHVPTGERRYFRQIEDISKLILPYLQELGLTTAKQTLDWRDVISTMPNHDELEQSLTESVIFIGRHPIHLGVRFTRLVRLIEWWRRSRW